MASSSLFQHQILTYFEQLYTFFEPFYDYGIDVDDKDGFLAFTLPDGRVLILTPHEPTQQIWFSSPLSGARHFSYDPKANAWKDTRSFELLPVVVWNELNEVCGLSLPFTSD